MKLTEIGENKAHGVIHEQSGVLVTVEPLEELVRERRLVPADDDENATE
ncbi:MAG: hypothetical protein ABEH65_06465 [Halobacteriales archaeon]